MVNVIRRQPNAVLPSLFSEWDALPSPMRALLRWGTQGFDPFREMIPAFEASPAIATYVPAFEVKENKEGFVFKADLPGIKEDDLKITVSGTRLSISGKREEEKKREDETFYCYERTYGSFERTFTLPTGADTENIKAELKNGQLQLMVPKKPEHQPKEVTVKVTGDKK